MKPSKPLTSLIFIVLAFIAAPAAHAQTNCSTMYTYYFPDPHGIPYGAFDVSWAGPYMENYFMMTGCVQRTASSETCPTCPACGKPIVLATGNTYIKHTDVQIPGLGGGLALTRTWNSVWPASQSSLNLGMFGPNWRSNYEERIFLDADDHYIRYSRGDGSYWSFAYTGPSQTDYSFYYHLVAPANVIATMKSGDPTWTITFQNGEQRVFDKPDGPHAGMLLAIVDRNGNTTQLSYDASNRLTTVTDPAGRHLNFTYGTGDASYVVTGVTSDPAAGLSLTYTYDSQSHLLTKVTNPDNTFTTLEYDGQSLISAVKDSEGKILESHTYDSMRRGLTSSRAGGVESITVTYPVQQ